MDHTYILSGARSSATPTAKGSPLKEFKLIDSMVRSSGLFHVDDHQGLGNIQGWLKNAPNSYEQARQDEYDTSDAVPHPRKKSKKQPVDQGALEDFVETFWKLLQRGIEAGTDDKGMKDGFIVATPHEIQEAEKPLKLRNYQIHAINRIIYILQSGGKGALLAYAMGLGKTVIVIALIAILKRYPELFKLNWPTNSTGPTKLKTRVQGKFLLVMPLALIPLWQFELQKRMEPSTSIMIYHGS